MNKQEKEVLDGVVEKLNDAKDFENFEFVTGYLLRNVSSKLPKGEIKEFFQKVEEHLPLFRLQATECKEGNAEVGFTTETTATVEKLEKSLEILEEVSENFEEGNFPKEIPQKIIETYEYFFQMGIFFTEASIENYKQEN